MTSAMPHVKREPLYRGLYQAVRRRIELGQLQPGTKAPSESDLIAEFHVSSTTARRCLNDLQTAGYVKRVQGKGTFVCAPPALMSCPQIGLLYNELFSLADVFLSHLLRGIGGALEGQDFQPMLLAAGMIRRSPDPAAALAELVERNDIQGLMILSPLPQSWLKTVLDAGVPIVATNFSYEDSRIASVAYDRPGAEARIAQRLMAMGHRRVVTIYRKFPNELLEGVRLTGPIGSHEIPGELEWEIDSFRHFEPDQTRRLVTKHLTSARPPTAFVALGYEVALEARQAIKTQGMRIPEDVSLMFVGTPAGPTDLSGEIIPVDDMGSWAARNVLARINSDNPVDGQSYVYPGWLHEGSTLAAPRL